MLLCEDLFLNFIFFTNLSRFSLKKTEELKIHFLKILLDLNWRYLVTLQMRINRVSLLHNRTNIFHCPNTIARQ